VDADVRRTALFWLGLEAAAAATEGMAGVAEDEDEDQEVRAAAIFALSQRPAEEGVPILMELARTAREPATRKTAFFWLAQSRDRRVVPFFRDVLLGRRGG
jgi:HEAT repeat protein